MIIQVLETIISKSENAQEAVKKIQHEFGGNRIYIPVANQENRNQKIMKTFTGNNHREVCEAFDISLSTLWRIIRVKPTDNLWTKK